jgi:hypothetical protein
MVVLCNRNHEVPYSRGDRICKLLEWRKKKGFAPMVPAHLCTECKEKKRVGQPYLEDEY